MRLSPSFRSAFALALAASVSALAGCATSRPDPLPAPAPAQRAEVAPPDSADGPARVGLAATMDIPDNPYGDTAAVEVPTPADVESGAALPLAYDGEYVEGAVDPNEVTVSRYYYDDEGTYYYEDVQDDLYDYGQGYDDDYYYGGYYADYYRYADPAYFPSVFRYYRPYRTYHAYARFGWYPTWHQRQWVGHLGSYYAFFPSFYYDPLFSPYGYGPGFNVAIGWGWGGYGYGGYGSGYVHGYSDGYTAGYYGPGYYGRPRHRDYYDGYRYDGYQDRGEDDGVRTPIRVARRNGSGVQSSPDPSRNISSRQPSRRGLTPARLPREGAGISRSTGRGYPARSEAPDRTTRRTGRAALPAPIRDPEATRTAPAPRAPARTTPMREPSRTAPTREPRRALPAPTPRRETSPTPRRETRPAPAPRRESRPAPAPRRESRPAPAPRRESRPAPPPRQQRSSPSRSSGGGGRSTGRTSRRGGND